ncbi:MAG: hypothetical protein ACI38Z_02900 [Parafannyhessea sp.]|uniref:hypothetical protein n=1 Tax=Parafannyhessea sp. TaxID=2847324 RepID=UPI003EFEA71A
MMPSDAARHPNHDVIDVLERDERLFSAMLAHDLEARVVTEVFRNRSARACDAARIRPAHGDDGPTSELPPFDQSPEPYLGWLADVLAARELHMPDVVSILDERGLLEGLLEREREDGAREALEETLAKVRKLFLALKAEGRQDELADDLSSPLEFACALDDLSID